MANRRRRQRVFFWLGAGCAAAGFLFPSAASPGSRGATAACDPPVVSAVACENTKAGNPSSEWDVAGAGDAGIQGFATDISVDQGETVRFKVDTAASDYRLDIYRLGYYAGLGARKVATVQPSASLPQTQPACAQEATTGLVDCGNWGESASWAAPADAVSGIYLAKLVREDGPSGASHIVFVVRDDDGGSELLFQTSDTTWQAYNTYGGNSFYTGSPAGRAYKVSYNRPVTTRGGYPEDSVFNAEYPMVRWLEANGYDVSYSTGVDSDRRGGELLEHKAFLSVGHDEYWSGVQRANVEAARSAGTNLAFFSGNEIFWKTRWENSIDGLGTPYRTLVCYKETHAGAKIDPTPAWTGTWRDPRFSPPADGGRPENALSGTIFLVNGGGGGSIVVPAADGKMRFWRNTSVATLGPAASATLPDGTLGYEYDEDRDNGARPPGLFRLSSATLTNQPILLDYGSTYGSGTATHHLTMYRAASGALVFGAGTIQWSWGLDSNHDRGSAPADPRMQQATVNLFADMGAQPATLQAGLVAGAASTDTVAPTTQITSPADGSTVNAGATVTISGTAADTGGGVVGGVEVSVDGGSTWHPATGRESWSYSWTPQATGPAALKSRAVDDSGNLGGVSTINVTVAAQSCPCSIWSSSTVPGGDGGDVNAVEVGVRFRSDVAGFITGIRFHKQSLNTGTHVGRLWSNSGGAPLAEVTFTSESASGWQEASFASPVAISANTTYLASYHTSAGHYSFNGVYFTSPTDNPPLHALQNGVDGANGVYRYGPGGTFPTDTYNAGNYWVDVVFSTEATDTTPPTVSSVTPASGATGVPTASNLTVTFSEPIDPSTITGSTFELKQGASLVAASVSYDAGTRTATLDPTGPLANSTSYTATVKGGAAGVKDSAGNPLAADYSWTFTTAAPPPPPPDEGPGGPILVATSAADPFGRYFAEILRSEGMNEFTARDISTVTALTLGNYDTVVLAEQPLTASQVTMFSDWVNAGGNLIASRPDKQLAGLLGLTDAASVLSNGYLTVDTSTAPGSGITSESMQFHGTADRYTPSGATTIATLYSNAATPTLNPAVTLRSVGSSGGQAAAFTYDLARSVVYTRQGNPAWSGQERDGISPIRSDDLFYGGAEPDWVDLNKVAIPQADEQQRLLVNLITRMSLDRKPLPRFWYFPRDEKAVVLMSGDDHAAGGTAGRFDTYKASSPAGCSVAAWECVRSSSYVYPGSPLTNAQASAYTADGFEVGLHVNTNCGDWNAASLESFYSTQLSSWSAQYSSIPPPSTNRTHCIVWSDYATQPKVELNHGIRLDTNYYYWPPGWVQNRPGLFTGSGMPQRFADLDGTMIDVYQAATQMTDESGQTYPFTIDTLLDRAFGSQGYYGVFTANMHTDNAASAGSDAIVASAQSRGVPVVSGRQLLTWLDGRNGSSFGSIAWSAGTLSFTIAVGAGADGLRAMVPTVSSSGVLTGVQQGGSPIAFTTETIKGIEYAFFPASAGSYTATYATDTTPPTVSSVTPASGATGVPTASNVTVTFSEPIDPSTITGSTFELRQGASLVAASVSYDAGTRTATLDPTAPLANSTSYTATVKGGAAGVKDSAGNPLAADYSWTFTTAAAPPSGFTDTTVADFSAGTPDAGVTVVETADGELILTPTAGSEFSGSTLPAGWETTLWDASGSATVGSGRLTLDAARAGTSALYGPGRSLEFVATFGAQAYEHVGFGVDYNDTPYWAMFSTFNGGGGLYARTNNNGSTVDTLIPGSLIGSSHRYRIDWLADSVVFSVDGTVVHTQPAAIAAQMRPLASDYLSGAPALSVDWLRLSPYTSPGSFLSRIFDAGSSVSWGAFSWNGQTPAGSTLRLYVRTGDTPTPDGSWSAFTELPSSGASVARSSRYLQYRADLATSDPAQTPVLESVSATYTSGGPTAVAVRSFSAHRLRPTGVRLQWRTASELGTVGFNLWRSRVGRYGFKKLNAALIPARRAGSSAGYRYRYLDRTASRLGYRYRLELVRLDGTRVWAGQSAVATPTN